MRCIRTVNGIDPAVCNYEKTDEVPSANANAFSIRLILCYIEFHALCLTQSKFNFSFPNI